VDVNVGTEQMLNIGWTLLGKYFSKTEVAIKQELLDEYWVEA
jgi:V/A-type H+-transporting ATPase subunit B